MYDRLGKTGFLRPWSRVIEYCSKLSFCQNDSPMGENLARVVKILKGSLDLRVDLIPSPSSSVKIQIIGGKVCLMCKGKILLGIVKKLLKQKVC